MAYPNPFSAEYLPQSEQQPPLPAPIIRAPASGRGSQIRQGVEAKQAKASPGRNLLQQLFAEQQDEVNKMRTAADAAEAKPLQVDLSPLMALADTWTGSKLAPSYKAPESPDDKQFRVAQMRKMAGEGQDKVSKDQLALLLGEGKDDTQLLKLMMGSMGSLAGDFKAQQLQWLKEKNLKEDLDKIQKPFEEHLSQLQGIDAGLSRGDIQSLGTAVSQYSREVAGEKGVLTNEDIDRTMPKNIFKDFASIKSYFSKNPAASIPPEYIKGMLEMTKLAKERLLDRTDAYLKGHRNSFSSLSSTKDLMQPGMGGDLSFRSLEDRVSEHRGKKRPSQVPAEDWVKLTPEAQDEFITHFEEEKKASKKGK